MNWNRRAINLMGFLEMRPTRELRATCFHEQPWSPYLFFKKKTQMLI
jgi:hypothetical protein